MMTNTTRKKKLRKAPAYQEYASDMLASMEFRIMSLEERGLLYTLQLELRHNVTLPADRQQLAKMLGIEPGTIGAFFTPVVTSFLRIDGDLITHPELDRQRDEQAARREAQSNGGKRSTEKMWGDKDTRTIDMFDADVALSNPIASEMRRVEKKVSINYQVPDPTPTVGTPNSNKALPPTDQDKGQCA